MEKLIFSRRWLFAFLGVAAVLFGLLMLHPYPRQSLFGPTIRGKPRCYWEAEVRRFGDRPKTLTDTLLDWLGVNQGLSFEEVFDDAEMIPIVVEMLDEADPETRDWGLIAATSFSSLQDPALISPLRRLCGSNDPLERGKAAHALWQINKDPEMIPIFLELLAAKNTILQSEGMKLLQDALTSDEAAIYPHVVASASHPDANVRRAVMASLSRGEKKGVPILISGLKDSSVEVRLSAAWALGRLGPDAVDAIPALERRLDDKDSKMREVVERALISIDAKRFKRLKGEGEIK
jgi:HEAT repeat protein